MRKVDESVSPTLARGDFTRGIPFYGTKGDFSFALGRSKFTPGISIKQVPLTTLAINGDVGSSEFDNKINQLRAFFKIGDRIRGILINSHLSKAGPRIVIGKISKIQPDYANQSIRLWLTNPKTLEKQEVYPESIEKIYESGHFMAKTFSQFVNS